MADAADSVHGQRQADGAGVPGVPRRHPAGAARDRKARSQFTPPGPNQIIAPGTGGGANYGPISYSPRTGLLYVTRSTARPIRAVDREGIFLRATTRRPGSSSGSRSSKASARRARSSPPAAWCSSAPAAMSPDTSMPYDAKTGELLWKFNTGSGVFSSPSDLYGERRAVRHRGLRRRRAGPKGRRPDSQLRAAEAVACRS